MEGVDSEIKMIIYIYIYIIHREDDYFLVCETETK